MIAKVDDELKVTRSRKDCPKCENGVRMAVHKDRLHCGKCSMTFILDGGKA
jgi:ubiquitin-small subunit ribosomal protein S27Ae